MSSIAEYFNPALWRDWFHLGVEQLGYAAFWLAVLQIVFVNFLLSGDNAVVIAMACRELPPQQRRWGLVIGAGVAVILRIILVGAIAWLMLLPYLKLVGGVALIFIAAKLLVPEDPDRDEIAGGRSFVAGGHDHRRRRHRHEHRQHGRHRGDRPGQYFVAGHRPCRLDSADRGRRGFGSWRC